MITSDAPLRKIKLVLLRAVGRKEGGKEGAVEEGGTAVERESREQAEWLSELLRNSTVGRGMCMYACVRASCAFIECLDAVLSLKNIQDRKSLSFFLNLFLSFFNSSFYHSLFCICEVIIQFCSLLLLANLYLVLFNFY